MGRKKRGHLQRAPECDSGKTKLARLYQQQEQQEQQRRQEEQRHQEQQRCQEQQTRAYQKQQERPEQQDHQSWGKFSLIVVGTAIILVAGVIGMIMFLKYASLVKVSLSIADQRAQECSQMYDNVTKITCLLHENMQSQLEENYDEIFSLKTEVKELQQKNAKEIQQRMRAEALVQTKDLKLENLKGKLEDSENRVRDLEKRNEEEIEGRMHEKKLVSQKDRELKNVKAESKKLQVAIKERDGEIDKLSNAFDSEKRALQSQIALCEREMEQKKSEGNGAGMVIIVVGAAVVLIFVCIFSGKKL